MTKMTEDGPSVKKNAAAFKQALLTVGTSSKYYRIAVPAPPTHNVSLKETRLLWTTLIPLLIIIRIRFQY
ncbi:unnamed protein product [Clonostachys rosea f. rosea IK726]|uniref:Uncharacterized protein n=1 Tax=Clonostachys rosea f. rosea IK726 TaxID=1349383 RepID=A0ACA9UHZ6_BIOOC|nr:unnamed protein product [Clonostachys rosea f. rosea IK726]